jgi:predicted membrane channel-forming protein YqfA (hemolysin III family)
LNSRLALGILVPVEGEDDMLFSGGFTFSNFLADVLSIFIFVLWFWLLITVFSDLFRRHDISGWAKVIWVIVLIIIPYLGIFIYLISQHRGMAERQQQRAQQARDELRQVVGYSVADEIEKLERLKNSGTISNDEYSRLRARVVQ